MQAVAGGQSGQHMNTRAFLIFMRSNPDLLALTHDSGSAEPQSAYLEAQRLARCSP